MKILHLIMLVACVGWQVYAQEDEGRAAPARGLLKRGPLAKGKTTTTTTTTPEPEYYDEEEEKPSEETPTTASTTPDDGGAKKLVAGGVRPFRSNSDLLETLKRRRAQAAEAKLHGHSGTAVTQASTAITQDTAADKEPAPAKSSFSKKRFNSSPAKEAKAEEPPAPSKPVRGRFGRPSPKAIQEEEEQQNESAPTPIRSGRAFRG